MHPASPRGFAAVARDHAEAELDLHRLMVPRPAATFFMKARGDAMYPFIRAGDLLVVDRSLEPRDGQVVIAAADGEFLARRFERENTTSGNGALLRADNPKHPILRTADIADFRVFGVVTWVVREMRNEKCERGERGRTAGLPFK
jgi:DNA polymerase V